MTGTSALSATIQAIRFTSFPSAIAVASARERPR
jgi:hypothetical protein